MFHFYFFVVFSVAWDPWHISLHNLSLDRLPVPDSRSGGQQSLLIDVFACGLSDMVNRREKVDPLVDHEVGKGWLEANHRNAPWLNVKIWCSTPKKVKMQVFVAQHPNKRLSAGCDPVPKPGFLVAANFNWSELSILSAGATHHVDHHSPLLDPRWIHLVLFLRSSPGCLSKCLSSHKRQLLKEESAGTKARDSCF